FRRTAPDLLQVLGQTLPFTVPIRQLPQLLPDGVDLTLVGFRRGAVQPLLEEPTHGSQRQESEPGAATKLRLALAPLQIPQRQPAGKSRLTVGRRKSGDSVISGHGSVLHPAVCCE